MDAHAAGELRERLHAHQEEETEALNARSRKKNSPVKTDAFLRAVRLDRPKEKGIKRPTDGFFLRAERFYAFASESHRLEQADPLQNFAR